MIRNLLDMARNARHRLAQCAHTRHAVKNGAVTTHVLYCGAVFIEGHGAYPLIAGVMGAFVLAESLLGE